MIYFLPSIILQRLGALVKCDNPILTGLNNRDILGGDVEIAPLPNLHHRH